MIIVLFGVKGSGKDTIGDLLVREYQFRKWAFASGIKQMIKLAFPKISDYSLYGPSEAREEQYEEYPFSGPCLACGHDVAFEDDAVYGTCQNSACRAEYPRDVNARIAAQTLGTEWGRRLYRNVWVDLTFGHMLADRTSAHHVVTDGRFHNERTRSQDFAAKRVLLTRGLATSTSIHPSEAELRAMKPAWFDHVLDNANMSLEQLPTAVSCMMNSWNVV